MSGTALCRTKPSGGCWPRRAPRSRRPSPPCVTPATPPEEEYYFSFLLDRANRQYLCIASVEGGVEIEEVAKTNPDAVKKIPVSAIEGVTPEKAAAIVDEAKFPAELRDQAIEMVQALWKVYVEEDATLVEVNPLARLEGDKLEALDGKVSLDDNASEVRHPDHEQFEIREEADPLEAKAKELGLNYVKLDGEVGIIGNGAGLVMSTLDVVAYAGEDESPIGSELYVMGRVPGVTAVRDAAVEREDLARLDAADVQADPRTSSRRIDAALERTSTSALADRYVDELSGGQRQRVWIAMALAQQTDLLLLDEPTTFLDVAHQVEVLDLLADLNSARGTTIVMVLHDLNLAARYSHHLVAMRNGELVAAGTPSEVIDEECVRTVFGLSCRVISDPVSRTPLVVPIGRHAKALEDVR